MRQCCLCEADWEELHWSLFHCGSCFPSRVFASMMIEQSQPDDCRKRSSSLRPARVRKGGGSHRVRGCMLTTRSFQHVSCAGQPAAMQVPAMPPDVSKAQAWMLWKFFHHLMLGRIHTGKLTWNLKMSFGKGNFSSNHPFSDSMLVSCFFKSRANSFDP